jgi:subtilase family serine protease
MVSSACPRCRIVLIEADTNATSDLAAAAATAAAAGSNVISNSYGTNEFTGMDAYEADYRHPGVFVTAASGDGGFSFPQFPAVMPDVAAVGGTSLRKATNARGWTEHAWGHGANSLLGGGAGSGCSGYIDKPAWQHDQDCLMRTTADVSAVADPDTGVAVYDTALGQHGWIVVGGTSAASPLVAGIIGLAGNAASLTTADLYHHKQDFNDVVGGSAGYCDGSYLCTGVKGYDGTTGLGTPNGTAGF